MHKLKELITLFVAVSHTSSLSFGIRVVPGIFTGTMCVPPEICVNVDSNAAFDGESRSGFAGEQSPDQSEWDVCSPWVRKTNTVVVAPDRGQLHSSTCVYNATRDNVYIKKRPLGSLSEIKRSGVDNGDHHMTKKVKFPPPLNLQTRKTPRQVSLNSISERASFSRLRTPDTAAAADAYHFPPFASLMNRSDDESRPPIGRGESSSRSGRIETKSGLAVTLSDEMEEPEKSERDLSISSSSSAFHPGHFLSIRPERLLLSPPPMGGLDSSSDRFINDAKGGNW